MRWKMVLAVLMFAGGAAAQLDVQWVGFAAKPEALELGPTLTSTTIEASFAVGDVDRDGWVDVLVAREEPGSPGGKRTSVLFLNDHGVLRDKTAQYAALSDVPGNQGFLTPSGDRDVELIDVDGDGWPDAVTARSLHDGEPKATSHPRVYHNLGEDGAGAWLGFKHEDARIPQLFTVGGLAVAPRFVAVSAGDVDNDGDLDLHFVDHDGVGVGMPPEASGADLNDRLLANDGLGWFTDISSQCLTVQQLKSLFGIDTRILDLNADGAADITHLTADGDPTGLFVEYNDPANIGHFQALGQQSIGPTSPYGLDIGELNNDGRPDVVIQDDTSDRFRLHQGLDALNRVIWGPLKTFTYAGGSDDGFGGNVRIQDLNGDAWNDVLICDADIDVFDCSKRLHIFHNTGTVPGSDVNLREEAQFNNGNTGTGWKGVVGLTALDLHGTYDAAMADFDHDGDVDMLLGRCTGSFFWDNQQNPGGEHCQTDLGHGGPGAMQLSICGDELLWAGATATLHLADAAPLQPVLLVLGLANVPTPLKGGTLVTFPPLAILGGFSTDSNGETLLPVAAFGGTAVTIYLQAIVKNGPVFEFSNALEMLIGI